MLHFHCNHNCFSLPADPEDVPKTAITTSFGSFQTSTLPHHTALPSLSRKYRLWSIIAPEISVPSPKNIDIIIIIYYYLRPVEVFLIRLDPFYGLFCAASDEHPGPLGRMTDSWQLDPIRFRHQVFGSASIIVTDCGTQFEPAAFKRSYENPNSDSPLYGEPHS